MASVVRVWKLIKFHLELDFFRSRLKSATDVTAKTEKLVFRQGKGKNRGHKNAPPQISKLAFRQMKLVYDGIDLNNKLEFAR